MGTDGAAKPPAAEMATPKAMTAASAAAASAAAAAAVEAMAEGVLCGGTEVSEDPLDFGNFPGNFPTGGLTPVASPASSPAVPFVSPHVSASPHTAASVSPHFLLCEPETVTIGPIAGVPALDASYGMVSEAMEDAAAQAEEQARIEAEQVAAMAEEMMASSLPPGHVKIPVPRMPSSGSGRRSRSRSRSGAPVPPSRSGSPASSVRAAAATTSAQHPRHRPRACTAHNPNPGVGDEKPSSGTTEENAPLENAKKEFEKKLKEANQRALKADNERMQVYNENEKGGELKEGLETEIGKLDKQLDKLRKKREEEEEKLSRLESEITTKRAQLNAAKSGEDPAARRISLQTAFDAARRDAPDAQTDLRNHESHTAELNAALQQAKANLEELNNVELRKMQKVASPTGNKHAAELANWVDAVKHDEAAGPRDVINSIGPLLMKIDVPDPSHQKLCEDAIGAKYAFAFLALSDEARTALNKKVTEMKWNVNVYRYSGAAFTSSKRPSSSDMARFGVTKWLDEAVSIAPENRDQILGTLKDLTAIDKYLLGTKRTQEKIEELQQYLAENQVDQVTILTPERTYRVQRSKYGNRALINTTQNPRARNDLYAIAADPKQLENAQAAFESAKHAFSEHTDRKAQLQERLTHLNEAKQQKQQELTTFNEGFSGIKVLEERRDLYKQRVEVARRDLPLEWPLDDEQPPPLLEPLQPDAVAQQAWSSSPDTSGSVTMRRRANNEASSREAAAAMAKADRGAHLASDDIEPGAFMTRYMAFRQYVEMILQFVPSKTAHTKPWRLLVRRAELARDVITHFGDFSKMKVFQPTQVTFIDGNGNEEEGVDLGGLTEEMFSSFFSEVLPDDH